jgi:hypothetical protein
MELAVVNFVRGRMLGPVGELAFNKCLEGTRSKCSIALVFVYKSETYFMNNTEGWAIGALDNGNRYRMESAVVKGHQWRVYTKSLKLRPQATGGCSPEPRREVMLSPVCRRQMPLRHSISPSSVYQSLRPCLSGYGLALGLGRNNTYFEVIEHLSHVFCNRRDRLLPLPPRNMS